MPYYHPEIEKMDRGELDALIDERVRYTVSYAAEHSSFYQKWFRSHRISPGKIREHQDLLELPIISGSVIRRNQPPETPDFGFQSVAQGDISTILETSGTSGVPKAFFLTDDDWERYAEKYARIFVSQGFGPGDRVVVCASYGMNVGASAMTMAARKVGFSVIPEGKCTFPVRVIRNYQPTAIIGSVFKLLHLARRMKAEGIEPHDSGIERLVVGGESFAPESRHYLDEIWGVESYNTYGSTEGTMCGECTMRTGLHVSEDLVHMDIYDPTLQRFVPDGDCGKIVLTTLIPVGEKAGMVLINYDTDDTTVVLTREPCACGRTHMKMLNPQREAETIWIGDTAVNRVDIERGVFQRDSMEYLTGEYEAFLYGGDGDGETAMRVSVECEDPEHCGRDIVEQNFLRSFLSSKPNLKNEYNEGAFKILFHYAGPGGLELHQVKGRPKRLVDRR